MNTPAVNCLVHACTCSKHLFGNLKLEKSVVLMRLRKSVENSRRHLLFSFEENPRHFDLPFSIFLVIDSNFGGREYIDYLKS